MYVCVNTDIDIHIDICMCQHLCDVCFMEECSGSMYVYIYAYTHIHMYKFMSIQM